MSTGLLDTMPGSDTLDQHVLPTSRDEAWHYSPLAEITAALDAATPAHERHLARAVVDELAGRHGPTRLVFVNGFFDPIVSDTEPVAGLWCGRRKHLPAEHTTTLERTNTERVVDGFQALNHAEARSHAVVIVDPGVRLADPVHIVNVTVPGAAPEICFPHTTVVIGDGASAHLIETFASLPGTAFVNAATDIHVGARGALTHHRVRNDTDDIVHIGLTTIDQVDESQVRATSVSLGGRIARHAVDVTLRGAGAVCDVDGLYLPTGRQRHDTMVRIDHAASDCSSTQKFSGVVDDHARGSFSGHIIVRPDTVNNDAHQSNRNLLLQPTAQADARPWLEILADDVRCTHGATIGRLDADAMFYLRSRGIPAATARVMLVEAFVHQIIDPITPPSLGDFVAQLVSTHTSAAAQ